MNIKFKKTAFINIFNQFNASLLNKSIHFKKENPFWPLIFEQ